MNTSNVDKKAEASSKRKKTAAVLIAVAAVALIVAAVAVSAVGKADFKCSSKSSFAMGTVVTVKLYGDENNYAAKGVVNDFVAEIEDKVSWRKEGSAVAVLNERSSVTDAALSDILNVCGKISKDSGGAFDATIGKVSRLWDFDSGKEIVPSEAAVREALKSVDYSSLKVSGTRIECKKNQAVDLGSVGKGYACDAVKALLEKTDVKGAVVSVGGSILAYGKRNRAGDKWRIAVRDPRSEQGVIGAIEIGEGFVSTSGDYEKFFEKDGVKYHHLLDARTGYPADSDLTSVTIVCDSGLLSDALSTACYILGKEKGTALAEKYGVGAVFIDKETNVSVVGDVRFERFADQS